MIETEEVWDATKTIVPSNIDSLEKYVALISIYKKPKFVIITPHQSFVLGH